MLFLPKEVETVITTLQGAGYSPYLVGGCVREMLRGKAPSDYDMTSDALPQEVLRLFGEWAHPTPEILPACPRFCGRMAASFSRASRRRPSIFA